VDLKSVVEVVGTAVELVGVAVIVVGAVVGLTRYIVRILRGRDKIGGYSLVRRDVGRALLLGLEFLVAGDIIQTVVGTIDFESLGLLAGVVVMRTFLSFTIDAEIEGRWPWQRRSQVGVTADQEAVSKEATERGRDHDSQTRL